MVLVEARVLPADQGLHEVRGDLLVGDHDPIFAHCPAVEGAVAVINFGALRHPADRREIEGQCPQIVEDTCQRPEKDGRESELDQSQQQASPAPWRRRFGWASVPGTR